MLPQASALYLEEAVEGFVWRADPACPLEWAPCAPPFPRVLPRLREPGQGRLGLPAPRTPLELIDG